MSRGLSTYQNAVMKQIHDKGRLSIIQVSEIVANARNKKIKRKTMFGDVCYESLIQIPQLTKMYRLMTSLEQRGLVARLLHKRPAVWHYVTWKNEKPVLSNGGFDYSYLMEKDGEVMFRTKGKMWKIEE